MTNNILKEVILPFVENLLDCGMSKYKKGDWVKFKSDEPSIYLSRYADGDSIINAEKHIGVIKDVRCILMGWYLYSIETFPVQWLCHINEDEIIEKLSKVQIEEAKVKYTQI